MARSKNKPKGVVKLQKPGMQQNYKAKFELAKTQAVDQCIPSTSHPSSSTSLALNKKIDNNMITNLTQTSTSKNRKRRKKAAVPNIPQPEKDAINASINRPLNIHQQRVLEKRFNKLESKNKVNVAKHDSSEAKKSNLNVHQLKVMEKLSKSKNPGHGKSALVSKSGGRTKTSPRFKDTVPVQPSASETPLSVQTPSGSKTPAPAQTWASKIPGPAQTPSVSKTPIPAQTWASKTHVSVQTPSGSKTPVPAQTWASKAPCSAQTPSVSKTPVPAQTWARKTPGSAQTPSGSKTPASAQTWASKIPGSAQTPSVSKTPVLAQTWAPQTAGSAQTPSVSKTPVPAQTWAPKTPGSAQTPSVSETPVLAQTWAPKTPGLAQTPSGSKTPVPAQTWASKTYVSAQIPLGSKTPVPAQTWASKAPGSAQTPSGSKIPVPDQTLNSKQSKNETEVGGSQSTKKTMQYTKRRHSPRKGGNSSQKSRRSGLEQVTPRQECDETKVAGKCSAGARLEQFRRSLSESDYDTPKVSLQSKPICRNLQNNSMTVDDQMCKISFKRKMVPDDVNPNKRKKVESEQLLNSNNESVSDTSNNIFDTSNNVLDTSNNIFDTSNNIFDTSNNVFDTSNNAFDITNTDNLLPENTFFNSSAVTDQSKDFEDEMDWETVVEQIMEVRGGLQHSTSNSSLKLLDNKTTEKPVCNDNKTTGKPVSNSSKPIFLVVDTNVFISHLRTVENLTDPANKGSGCEIRVMVPYIVLCELDKLKMSTHGNFTNLQAMARKVMRYFHNNLTSNPKICGQSAKAANERLLPCQVADDEILNCCLQLSEAGETVVLLTNDINLCNKAAVNNINALTHKQFVVEFFESLNYTVTSTNSSSIYENKLPPAKIEHDLRYVNNSREFNRTAEVTHVSNEEKQIIICNTVQEKFYCLENLLCQFLSMPLEDEMKDKFDNLWTKVVLVEPPWTLSDILRCLMKHWIAVFSETLPRGAQSVVQDLQSFFPPRSNARRRCNTSEANLKYICSLGVKLVEYFKLNRKYSQCGHKCIQDIQNILTNTYDKSKTNSLDDNTVSNIENIQENKSTAFSKDNSREDDFWNDSTPKVADKMRSSIIKPSDVFGNETCSTPKEILQNTQPNLRTVNSNQMIPKNTFEISRSTTENIHESKSIAFWKDDSREDDFRNDSTPKVANKMGSSIIKLSDLFGNETCTTPKEILQNTQPNLRTVNSNQIISNNTLEISRSTNENIQEDKSIAFWKDNSREDDFRNDSTPKVANKMGSSIINPSDKFGKETSSPKEILQNTQPNSIIVNSNKVFPENTLEIRRSTNSLNRGSSSDEIVEILKLILQGLCKFCANLANALEVPHSLNVVNEKVAPLWELVTQATPVLNQLHLIVNCTSRMLTCLLLTSFSLQQKEQESILASEALSNVLYDTLYGMGHTSVKLDSNDFLSFCTMHRNLLEEAYNDFVILHNLITECSQKYAARKAA